MFLKKHKTLCQRLYCLYITFSFWPIPSVQFNNVQSSDQTRVYFNKMKEFVNLAWHVQSITNCWDFFTHRGLSSCPFLNFPFTSARFWGGVSYVDIRGISSHLPSPCHIVLGIFVSCTQGIHASGPLANIIRNIETACQKVKQHFINME